MCRRIAEFARGYRGRTVVASLLMLWAAGAPLGAPPAAMAPRHGQSTGGFTGRVVGVLDGDSLLVLRDGRQVEVRLYGVDAPEGGQAYGSVARRFLSNLVFGKTVAVDVRDIDRYKRSVARLTVEGADVGLEMIRAGFAWHYARYSHDARYAEAEQAARSARRGLWQDRAPVAPWTYRLPRHPNASSPAPSPRASSLLTPAPPAGAAASVSGPFHGNVSSHVFHAPRCGYYNCRNCTAVFATYEAALAAGYRPHAECVGR